LKFRQGELELTKEMKQALLKAVTADPSIDQGDLSLIQTLLSKENLTKPEQMRLMASLHHVAA